MKTNFKTALSCFLALLMCLSVLAISPSDNTANAFSKTIFLDPGHGDHDPGAMLGSRYEKDDVLKLALRVGELLEPVANVVYTRDTDVFISLQERYEMANNHPGTDKYFCSIHRNAGGGRGVETYYAEDGTADENAMAQAVQNRIATAAPWPNRGVKTATFQVLVHTEMSAILTEVGFVDSEEDNELFDQYFEDLAYAIAGGLASHIGSSIINPNQHKKLNGYSPLNSGNFYAQIRHPYSEFFITDDNGNAIAAPNEFAENQIWKFTKQDDDSYVITSTENGKALTVAGDSYVDGVNISLEDNISSEAQRFYIYFINQKYYFRPAFGDRVFDVDADTKNLQLWGDSADKLNDVEYNARSFELIIFSVEDILCSDFGDSFTTTIKNSDSGKYLTANNSGLKMGDATNSDEQKWMFVKSEIFIGAYEVKSLSTGLNLDISMAEIKVGTSVGLFEDNNTKAQAFYLFSSGDSVYLKPSHTNNVVTINADDTLSLNEVTNENKAYQVFEISKPSFDKLTLNEESELLREDNYLKKVKPEQTVYDILSNFENTDAKVKEEDGNELSLESKVGTGCVVSLDSGDSVTVIILGDINGDGLVDSTDYMRIKSAFLQKLDLSEAFSIAADVDLNGKLDSTDYMRVKGHFLCTYDLFE